MTDDCVHAYKFILIVVGIECMFSSSLWLSLELR